MPALAPVSLAAACVLAAAEVPAAGAADPGRARAELASCQQGDGDACARAASLYAEGKGVERSPTLAVVLLQQGCQLGSRAACSTLERDAVAIASRACDDESASGCELLGRLYLDEKPRAAAKAVAAFVRAADLVVDLDQCYAMAAAIAEKDVEIALTLARRCCDRGSKRACAFARMTGGPPIERAPGAQGRTVAELFAQRQALAGKPVSVRGLVRDVDAGFGGGPTLLHLWDGTNAGEHDHLVVLTSGAADIGDVVTVSGVVRLDFDDFQPALPVVLERAAVARK